MSCISLTPPLFILIILLSSHYLYIYVFCFGSIESIYQLVGYLILINIAGLMLLWSFFVCMMSSVGKVPREYQFNRQEQHDLMDAPTDDAKDEILEQFCRRQHLMLHTSSPIGSIRYCMICLQVKPDRAHHCSTCDTCYLKMDHHCPWVNNCIGFKNYKSFILLIFYTFLYCLIYVSTSAGFVVKISHQADVTNRLLFLISVGLGVIMCIVVLLFWCYHLYLVKKNETTIENIHPPNFIVEDASFDLGTKQNFVEVFGDKCYLWFLPVFSSMGTGHRFLVQVK